MKKNLYYDYRKWVFFWGLFLDQQKEIQSVLEKHNSLGWSCVQFQWNGSKYSILRLLLILIIQILTLGFISYRTGFSIVFEKTE